MSIPSTNQFHITLNSFKQSKTKKKNLPISINSNIAPGPFQFHNKVSKVATSYKNIGNQINTYEKIKQLTHKGKYESNILKINDVFSMNSITNKNSDFSNNSIINKNNSKIVTNRANPSNNFSNCLITKNNLINSLLGLSKCTSRKCSKNKNKERYTDILTKHKKHNLKIKASKKFHRQKSLTNLVHSSHETKISSCKRNNSNLYSQQYKTSFNLNNNSQSIKRNEKNLALNSQTIFNTITITSGKNKVQNTNENLKRNTLIVNNNCSKNKKNSSSKNKKEYKKKKTYKKIIHAKDIEVSYDKTNINKVCIPYYTSKNQNIFTISKNLYTNNHKNVLTTSSPFNTTNTIGNVNTHGNTNSIKNEISSRKRGLSHGKISLASDIKIKPNEISSHHKSNRSVNVNKFTTNGFIINKYKHETKQQKTMTIQHNAKDTNKSNNENIQHKPKIKINLNSVFQDIKILPTNKTNKNITIEKKHEHKTQISQKQIQNNPQTHNNNVSKPKQNNRNNNDNKTNNNVIHLNLFNNNIIYDDIPLKDDPFDNLNDVVKHINFNKILTNQTNIFSVENPTYKNYQNYFDAEFTRKVKAKNLNNTINMTITHKTISTGTKSSERTNVHNVSISTQDNSNTKRLSSPIHKFNSYN